MWKADILMAAALACAIPSLQAQPAALPPGPMQQKAQTACLECHDAHIIVQQRLDRKLWSKEVDKMIRWGALVDPKDRDALVDYLSEHFSPGKPPYQPERTRSARR
jgi:hypothetical protein